jgi:hypothetical protein
MKIRKSQLSMAVSAALAAACLIPSVSLGYSINTLAGAPGTLDTPGTLNTDSGGDVLLFPIYTTANGATTSFSVTNTSATQTVLTKVRFREQMHSMDALDFYVILSPSDKFDFTVSGGGANGRPVMSWKDNSCVVGPALGTADTLRSQEFPAAWTPYVAKDADLAVGHLEVLGLVALGTAQAAQAKHNTSGVPANCGALRTAFADPVAVQTLNKGGTFTDAGNVLVGRYVITVPNQGLEGGGDAIAIRDGNLARETVLGDGSWHVTAQSGKLCADTALDSNGNGTTAPEEMNCRTNSLYAWDTKEWDHPHLGEIESLAAFDDALAATKVAGDWSNNPVNSVGVDWVMSFPNKYVYLDYVSGAWVLLSHPKSIGAAADATVDGTWTTQDKADLCLSTKLNVYNTEELKASEQSVIEVSPGNLTTTSLDFCNELNVFTLSTGTDTVLDSVIQTTENRKVVTFPNLSVPRGWADLTIGWPTGGPGPGAVSGVIFTIRHTDDATINNASLTELQKFQ